MSGNEETSLLEGAIAWLRAHLPSSWEVSRSQRTVTSPGRPAAEPLDGAVDITAPNGTYTTIAVEARRSFAPRDVETLLPRLARSLRALAGNVPVLVVAPWLSPRTQELLSREGINFLDLSGNARLQIDNPALFVRAVGAARDPQPPKRGSATTLRGARAGRVVRFLADVRPPYSVRDLALAAQITPGYASKLLDALDNETLVERGARGQVVDVDVPALLRRWASAYEVFARGRATTYIAPAGAGTALRRLAEAGGGAVVTGSFAAVRLAPVAAPSLLAVYCREREPLVTALDLLPADEGGNVALLLPFDDVVFSRTDASQGLRFAAPSQVVVDCLTGTGRMPAEGEAVLGWMTDHEDDWRATSLDAFLRRPSE